MQNGITNLRERIATSNFDKFIQICQIYQTYTIIAPVASFATEVLFVQLFYNIHLRCLVFYLQKN